MITASSSIQFSGGRTRWQRLTSLNRVNPDTDLSGFIKEQERIRREVQPKLRKRLPWFYAAMGVLNLPTLPVMSQALGVANPLANALDVGLTGGQSTLLLLATSAMTQVARGWVMRQAEAAPSTSIAAKPDDYPPNYKVLASSSQFASSYGHQEGAYTRALILEIARLGSLEKAHHSLMRTGVGLYPTEDSPWEDVVVYPTARPEPLGGWDCKEKKERFAILIEGQLGEEEKNRPPFDTQPMKRALIQQFQVPEENMTVLQQATYADLKAAIQALQDKKDAEILIYYTGHGSVLPESYKTFEEGSAMLFLDTTHQLDSRSLSRMVNRHLPNASKVYTVLDCCHAGAAI